MDYVNLGKSGLKVSRLCIGCMSFGEPARGNQDWSLSEGDTRPIIKKALDAGINFFDTANVYSHGSSEEITGKLLRELAPRDSYVLATKVYGKMRDEPNGQGLSRKAILTEMDHSLSRLGVDYVDLYQIHRWDYKTPIEETLEALHDLVKAGKTRYIGASSMWAYQFAKALYTQDAHGWTRFIAMQNQYSLLYREEEREMMKLCQDENIGVIPWSPLARGRAARPWGDEGSSGRAKGKHPGGEFPEYIQNAKEKIVAAVQKIAKERSVPMSHVAMAWHFTKPYVTSPIVGVTKLSHLEDAIAACDLKLTADEVKTLEEPYVPHPIQGHQ